MTDYTSLMQITYCNSVEVLQLTERLCEEVANIKGDFAEAGIGAGAHCVIMSRYRTTHMIDSFEGIPMHTDEDIEWTEAHGKGSGEMVSSGITVHGEKSVLRNIQRHGGNIDNCKTVKGWFADTLPLFNQPLALLRLDCDLYQSYKCCMQYLYPLLSPGGYVIIDDFSLSGCVRALVEAGIDMKSIKTINNGTVAYWQKKL